MTTQTRTATKKSRKTKSMKSQSKQRKSQDQRLAQEVSRRSELRQFTLDFFRFFNGQIEELDDAENGSLRVRLPEDLAAHFGKPELHLIFHNVAESASSDLVAHGSRIFDRMLAYLNRTSALTVQQLPRHYTRSDELLQAIHPVNASIANLRMQEETRRLFVFNWRVTYRADDKREELYAVVLDEDGVRLPLQGESQSNGAAVGGVNLDQLFADAASETESLPANGATAQADTGDDAPQRSVNLPPMTHLVRLSETACKYAIYHADLRCVSHEAEILPRLYQTLNRLTTYYEQQIQEVYDAHDPTGEKRRALENDLERKIAEEVENHRLRVQVVLFSYAILELPAAVANVTLSDGQRQASLEVVLNRYDGTIQRPVCHACGNETTTVALDRNGHISCDDCLRECDTCHDVLCVECGVEACPVCDKQNCDTCGAFCWACGGRACKEHISVCPVCGDSVCHDCQIACAACGECQCRSHLRVDCVEHGASGEDDTHPMICSSCAVRCPGCQQYSAQIDTCRASGQRFCANCLVTCARCGEPYGPGFYKVYVGDNQPYCMGCMEACPACQELTPDVVACKTCGVSYCHNCGLICEVCGQHGCDDHAYTYIECGHVVCSEHRKECCVGGEGVCPICNRACGICERYYCYDHSNHCRRCGGEYCNECVRLSGLCDTCATIVSAGQEVDLAQEPCASNRKVAGLVSQYHWVRAENQRYVIYLGQGKLMTGALVVVEKQGEDERVLLTQKLSPIDALRDKLRR